MALADPASAALQPPGPPACTNVSVEPSVGEPTTQPEAEQSGAGRVTFTADEGDAVGVGQRAEAAQGHYRQHQPRQ